MGLAAVVGDGQLTHPDEIGLGHVVRPGVHHHRCVRVAEEAVLDECDLLLEEKPLVKRCYDLWYQALLDDADSVETSVPDAKLVELGSGSSYLASLRPGVVTSDVEAGVGDM